MFLSFTGSRVTNTSLVDDNGTVMYQIQTTFTSPVQRKTRIYRGPIKLEDTDHEAEESRPEAGEDEEPTPISDSKEIARIHWHLFNKSRIVYGTQIVDFDKIFQKVGPLKM
jgi:hypothetical protein